MHLNRNQYGRYFFFKLSEWLMLPAMVEVTHFYGTVNFVTVGTWDGTGYRTMLMLYQKKSPKNTVLST
jgi:hypothetical protein